MESNINKSQYPENVFAGFWIRFFAYLVDLIVIGSFVRLINGPISIITNGVVEISIWYISFGAALIIYPLYFVLFTGFSDGQTLGKMIFGIRVVCLTEEKLSWKTVIVRELFGRYIQKVILLLYLVAAVAPKKQHVVDMLMDTAVISDSHLEAIRFGMNFRTITEDVTVHADDSPAPVYVHVEGNQ
jgi:uncharacterized RDD family membrane protein YckC